MKGKIDKFKQHLPVLHVICNPGIRDRHWEQMSDIVNFDIRPKEDTTLLTFLEYGLHEYLEKLEEIGGAAAKEHSLEKAMAKMKEEWQDMAFELVEYRDTVGSSFNYINFFTG